MGAEVVHVNIRERSGETSSNIYFFKLCNERKNKHTLGWPSDSPAPTESDRERGKCFISGKAIRYNLQRDASHHQLSTHLPHPHQESSPPTHTHTHTQILMCVSVCCQCCLRVTQQEEGSPLQQPFKLCLLVCAKNLKLKQKQALVWDTKQGEICRFVQRKWSKTLSGRHLETEQRPTSGWFPRGLS